MPVCKGCGASFDEGFKFCPNCGRAAPEAPTLNLRVTSDDVWESCEITLVFDKIQRASKAQTLILGKEKAYMFEAAAIGPRGRYGAGWSEALVPQGFFDIGQKDYYIRDGEVIFYKDRAGARAKLDGLIQTLTSDGWQSIGRGEHWYSERFRRTVRKK